MKPETNYKMATENMQLILCNDILKVDPELNFRFALYDEESETETEIYQWFLTDASESEVEYLEKRYNLLFAYSEKLDLFVLCVDHWGTSWEYVPCVDNFKEGK